MMTLYHAAYLEIREPDIHRGRINADFGQGFYTTDDRDFAYGWAIEKPGFEVIVNRYELDDRMLKIKVFDKNPEWYRYIFANRRLVPDSFSEYDLIIGPIACDTIYDTLGIITSGFLSDEEAMELLLVGDSPRQVVLKTAKAAENLHFISSEILSKEQIERSRIRHEEENEKFQGEFAKALEKL